MIEEYHNNKYKKSDLIKEVKYLLNKYPNKYLEESTFINGGQDETLARRTNIKTTKATTFRST